MWRYDDDGNLVWVSDAGYMTVSTTSPSAAWTIISNDECCYSYNYSILPIAYEPEPRPKCIFDE